MVISSCKKLLRVIRVCGFEFCIKLMIHSRLHNYCHSDHWETALLLWIVLSIVAVSIVQTYIIIIFINIQYIDKKQIGLNRNVMQVLSKYLHCKHKQCMYKQLLCISYLCGHQYSSICIKRVIFRIVYSLNNH